MCNPLEWGKKNITCSPEKIFHQISVLCKRQDMPRPHCLSDAVQTVQESKQHSNPFLIIRSF